MKKLLNRRLIQKEINDNFYINFREVIESIEVDKERHKFNGFKFNNQDYDDYMNEQMGSKQNRGWLQQRQTKNHNWMD